MEILENHQVWRAHFQANWLAHLTATGETNFKLYEHPQNQQVDGMPGIDLSQSRLLFISTAGAYVPESQGPFDAASLYGDYSLRTFPVNTPFDAIAYAHDHYDHTDVEADPQVLLPLHHLADMVAEGKIGELATNMISFAGYHPDVGRVLDELVPEVLAVARAEEADAALLVPA